jgi:hypothetical protein
MAPFQARAAIRPNAAVIRAAILSMTSTLKDVIETTDERVHVFAR